MPRFVARDGYRTSLSGSRRSRQNAKLRNWLYLIILSIMFGSAPMFNKLAVQDFSPVAMTAVRVYVAAIVLAVIAFIRKESFGFLRNTWGLLVVLAVFGNCLPFYLISWGQQTVDSTITGILMAIMPLVTIVLAHFYIVEERLTVFRIVGFLLGFAGIVMLFGPTALANLENSASMVISMLSIVSSAVFYAIATVLAKRLQEISFLAVSTVVMAIASLVMLPALILTSDEWLIETYSTGFLALLALGIFPTALATIMFFAIIARAGPSFLSQSGYLIPVCAVLMGVMFLDEVVDVLTVIALIVILAGIAISQHKKNPVAKID